MTVKRSKSPVKAVVFDLGNVLVKINYKRSIEALGRKTGLSEDEVIRRISSTPLHVEYESGLIDTEEFIKRFALLFPKIGDGKFNRLLFADFFDERLVTNSLMRELKKDYKIFMLSNTNPIHFEHIMEKYDFEDLFDEIYLSYELGVMKPLPLIYEKVIKASGLEAGELLFIDDSADNIDAARETGMKGVVFETEEKLTADLKAMGILRD